MTQYAYSAWCGCVHTWRSNIIDLSRQHSSKASADPLTPILPKYQSTKVTVHCLQAGPEDVRMYHHYTRSAEDAEIKTRIWDKCDPKVPLFTS